MPVKVSWPERVMPKMPLAQGLLHKCIPSPKFHPEMLLVLVVEVVVVQSLHPVPKHVLEMACPSQWHLQVQHLLVGGQPVAANLQVVLPIEERSERERPI